MVQIIKPRTLGILVRTQRRGGNTLYIVSALGLFDVAAPGMFLSEQALWPAVAEELPEGAVFDSGMPKPQGELLIAGHAKTLNGAPLRAMLIEVALGTLGKRVAVFGDRYWMPGASGFMFTEPQPFTEMKIDLRRMYGGADHPLNTQGAGYRAARLVDAGQAAALPNFEDPRRLIRTIEETPPPFGLGPIDILASDRRKYAGTFDKAWQEKIAPHPPLDTDPRIHCMAPEDQRIAGFFQGDEPLRVNGMTREEQGYVGRLPGLRARAFVTRTSEPAGLFELEMKLDTVLLLGSHRKGVVVFRGMLPVADVDAKDVANVMLAYERLRDEPRSLEYYGGILHLRTDKQQAMKYALADHQLSPEISEEEKSRRRKAREDYRQMLAERFADGMHLVTRRQMAQAGLPESLVPAKPAPSPLPVLLPTPEELESGDVDLAEILDGVDTMANDARQRLEAIRDKVEAARGGDGSLDLSKLLADLEGFGGIDTGAARQGLEAAKARAPSLDDLLNRLGDAPADAGSRMAQAGSVLTSLLQDGNLPAPPEPDAADEDAFAEARGRFLDAPDAGIIGKVRANLAEAREKVAAQATRELPAREGPPKPPSPIGSFVDTLATQAKERPEANIDTRTAEVDQKLRGTFPALAVRPETPLSALLADLSGAMPATTVASPAEAATKLDAADKTIDDAASQLKSGFAQVRRLSVEPLFPDKPMTPATALRFGMFIYEQWRQGCDLRGRDLAGADLSGMDFGGADLRGAFLERANLSRADLRGAVCEQTVFAGAKLDAACFDDAILKGANLSRASAKAASFQRANLEDINAIEACFAGADLTSTRFAGTQAIKTDFTSARLTGAIARNMVFIQCQLDQLDASGAVFERCQIVDCSAQRFAFRGGSMQRCAVVKFRAPQADFSTSTLDGTGFASGAEIPGGCFDGASLRGVTLQKADLTGASFIRARLDGAFVSGSRLAESNFTCASLKRAQFAAADLSHCQFFAANFFEAQLRRANLSGARLRAANLYSANFADTNLTGADFTAANRNKSQLAQETSHGE